MMNEEGMRHQGIEASSRGKAEENREWTLIRKGEEKTSADYADFFKRIFKRKDMKKKSEWMRIRL